MGRGRSQQRVHSEDVGAGRAGRFNAAPRMRFFDALHPLAVFVAVCGLVPIAFKPRECIADFSILGLVGLDGLHLLLKPC